MDIRLIINYLHKYLMAHNNAVAHKDYTGRPPIQISVFKDNSSRKFISKF